MPLPVVGGDVPELLNCGLVMSSCNQRPSVQKRMDGCNMGGEGEHVSCHPPDKADHVPHPRESMLSARGETFTGKPDESGDGSDAVSRLCASR